MADRNLKPLDVPETASPGNPPAGFRRIYGKADGHTYGRDSAGTETQLDNAAAANAADEAFAFFL